MRLSIHHALLVFAATFLAGSFVFAAQGAPVVPPGASTLQALWTYAAPTLAVVGAVGVLLTALGHLVMLLAVKWPALAPLAHMLVAGGADVGKFVMNAQQLAARKPPSPPSAPNTLIPVTTMLALACVLAFGTAGCSNIVTTNPAVIATDFEAAATRVDQIAVGAFNIALPLLPAADQAQAQADFTLAQATFTSSLVAIDEAVKAYQDGTSQNWSQLFADAEKTIDAIVSIVDLYTAPKAGAARMAPPATFATQRALLLRATTSLHRYH